MLLTRCAVNFAVTLFLPADTTASCPQNHLRRAGRCAAYYIIERMNLKENGSLPAGRQGFAHPPRNVVELGIQPGMKIADFGAGSGAYVLAMAERMANSGHVYAIDVQRDLLRRIHNEAHKRGYKNVEIIWNDLERPNGSHIADRYLDLVLISNFLFQVASKEAIFREAWRIVKPTGKLVVIDWTESYGGMGPQKEDVVSKEAAMRLAARGFELVREFNAGTRHYGLIFRPVVQKEI